MKITTLNAWLIIGAMAIMSCNTDKNDEAGNGNVAPEGTIHAELTDAPNVPPPIKRTKPANVIVDLEVKELVKQLADGVDYTFWTFGGSVPGKFIRVREGDQVEFRLHNAPDSKNPHNIDLHAVTGPGGGAAVSLTAPGKTSVFTFKTLNPGLFVYHCATAPVGMHIANGMYGLILVEPKAGLPKVDKEYYVMQSEFYTKGKHGEPGLQPFDMEKALMEIPDYVVFNGSVGSMVGDNAITAKVGEKVRLFVGNGGPNLVSSFHVIGEIFDLVYTEGGTEANQKNAQTTLVPAGGSAMVEFKVDVPGTFILVDHSIFRTFNKGSLGMLKVEGPENKQIYGGRDEEKEKVFVYLHEGSAIQSMPSDGAPTLDAGSMSAEEFLAHGKKVFMNSCVSCHQAEGQGIPAVFPPVAKSDWIAANTNDRMIKQILIGSNGGLTVNGTKYNSVMPGLQLSDADVSAVLTYVTSNFGNKARTFTPEEVKKARGK